MTAPRDDRPTLAFLVGWLAAAIPAAVLIVLELPWDQAMAILTLVSLVVSGAAAAHLFLPPRR